MKKIINIAWKDIKNRFTSFSEILFYLVLPVLFIFMVSGGLARFGSDQELPRLAVVDEDQTALSKELVTALKNSKVVEVETLSLANAASALEDEQVDATMQIAMGFEGHLLDGEPFELELQAPEDTQDASAVEQEALTIVETLSRSLLAAHVSTTERELIAPFSSVKEREAYFENSLSLAQEAFANLPDRVEMAAPDQSEAMDLQEATTAHYTAGQLVTWVFIPLLGTSVVLTDERTMGTLRRLLITPTSKSTFLLGTFVGQLVPAWLQMALLIGFGGLVMGVYWGGSMVGLVVLLLAFSLASVAFGTLMGTVVKTPGQANNLSIMSGMAMALLGGCWWPSELFPEVLLAANRVLPTSWVMDGLHGLMLQGFGLVEVLPLAGVLLGFAVVFFLVGVWRYRFE
jgi:ABC-2 type transport system permease protein